jgi:hypothetical protein
MIEGAIRHRTDMEVEGNGLRPATPTPTLSRRADAPTGKLNQAKSCWREPRLLTRRCLRLPE